MSLTHGQIMILNRYFSKWPKDGTTFVNICDMYLFNHPSVKVSNEFRYLEKHELMSSINCLMYLLYSFKEISC